MAWFETWFKNDLAKPINVVQLQGVMFNLDNLANKIGVELEYNGQPAALEGTIAGYVIRNDGTTLNLTTNTGKEGNKAWVILPQEAYTVEGPISIVIKLVYNSAETTIGACAGYVTRSRTSSEIAPTGTVIPSLASLEAAIAAANAAAVNAADAVDYIAPTEADSTASMAYATGSYFIHDGKLMKATSAIAQGATIVPYASGVTNYNCVEVPNGLSGDVYNVTNTANAAANNAADAQQLVAPVESMAGVPTSVATMAHATGSYFVYGGALCKATADIAIGDPIATTGAGANIAQVTGGVTGEVADLKSALSLDQSGEMTISGSFSYGVFNNNNFPEADPRKFNAVMMQSEQYDRDITITAKTGYNFLAYWYDENDNYVGKTFQWVTSRAIPANTPFRLWVRESPLDTSVILDLTVVKNHIVFNTPQQDEIDKNISDVALNTTNVNLNSQGLQQIDADFVWGTMNTSTGAAEAHSAYKYQVVMPIAVHYDRDVTIKCNAGYRYQVWWYSATDEYISRTGGFKTSSDEYVVIAGTYFRLFVTLDPPTNQAVVDPSVFTANVFLVTVIGEKVDAIVNQPLSTFPEYVLNTLSYKPVGPLSKGYILMSCDDGTAGLATYTIPMLINKGVPATFGLLDTSPVITNGTYLATVIDAVENHGCCIAQHGSTQWPTYSEKALTAYFDSTETLFNSKGISEIHGAICPGGASADTNTLVKAIAGGRFGSVFSGGLQDELKYGNYNEAGPRTNQYAMARYSAIGFTAVTYQAAIDEAYENHYILCPFWHDYSVVDDTAKQAIIEGMIDYAKTKGLTFITMADLPYIT